MRFLFLFFFIGLTYAQTPSDEKLNFSKENSSKDSLSSRFKKNNKSIRSSKPPIDLYKIYSLNKDTTYVDTSLTIQSEYKYNLLKKDIFGLLPFSNEGQTYNTLDFGLIKKRLQPNMGFTAKHFNYIEANDVQYYSVPTPLTDLYYKTVMEQGQSLDAFLTVNTKENFNFSIGINYAF